VCTRVLCLRHGASVMAALKASALSCLMQQAAQCDMTHTHTHFNSEILKLFCIIKTVSITQLISSGGNQLHRSLHKWRISPRQFDFFPHLLAFYSSILMSNCLVSVSWKGVGVISLGLALQIKLTFAVVWLESGRKSSVLQVRYFIMFPCLCIALLCVSGHFLYSLWYSLSFCIWDSAH